MARAQRGRTGRGQQGRGQQGRGQQGRAEKRAGLGVSKAQAATAAALTVDTMEKGWYHAPSGAHVTVADSLQEAIEGTILYTPEQIADEFSTRCKAHGVNARKERSGGSAGWPVIDVKPQTTLEALADIWDEYAALKIADSSVPDAVIGALNFASAKNPGGGFLGGARAQEESLARSSGLYFSLTSPAARVYYVENKKESKCIYTDHVIYTPACPVIKDDAGTLREVPMKVTFITAPAVNAGVVRKRLSYRDGPDEVIRDRMERRIRYVLDIAAENEVDRIVLGAFGCGVFRNDPAVVAAIFYNLLVREGYAACFSHIVFAIPGKVEANLNAFLGHNWALP